jgi:hypothetical protein
MNQPIRHDFSLGDITAKTSTNRDKKAVEFKDSAPRIFVHPR